MSKGYEQKFFQRYVYGQQVHEIWSASLIIKKMQIKAIMRYHFTHVKMAIVKETRDKR